MTKAQSLLFALFVWLAFILTGCGASQDLGSNLSANHSDGSTLQAGTPNNPNINVPPPNPGDPNLITVAIKYVSLKANASDAASPTKAEVETLMSHVSSVWSQCSIRFFLESYDSPVASSYNLNYNPSSHAELEQARATFDDQRHALFVKTGLWNRNGELGADGSNGFSTLPPSNPAGMVFEDWVAMNTLLISHETGHLVGGLGHTNDTTNLMNHFVTAQTTNLSSSQCNNARATIRQYLAASMR